MDAHVGRRRFQVSIRSVLLLIACLAVLLLVCPSVWRYATIPRPKIGAAVTSPLVDNVELELQVFACDLADLERLGLTPVDGTHRTQVLPTMSEQVKQIRTASRWGEWKAIAFPSITTPSGVPQNYARTLTGVFNGIDADYRIDVVPITLGNHRLRLELRSALVAEAHLQTTDVAVEIGDGETLIVTSKVGNDESADGLITIAMPAWTTSGMERRVAIERRHNRGQRQ